MRLTLHREHFEREVSLASTEETLKFFARYEDSVRRTELSDGFGHRTEQEKILENDSRGTSPFCAYEAPSNNSPQCVMPRDYRSGSMGLAGWQALNRPRTYGSPNTGNWVVGDAEYKKWRDVSRSPTSSLGARTLSIQGSADPEAPLSRSCLRCEQQSPAMGRPSCALP